MTASAFSGNIRLYPLLKGTRSFRPTDMLAAAPADPSIYLYANDANAARLVLTKNHNEPRTISSSLSGDQSDTQEKTGITITRDGALVKLTLTSGTTTDVPWRLVWK